MSKTYLHRGIDSNPELLRALFGVRFHHVHLANGRLIATFATEPMDLTGDRILVSAAICANGDSPSRFRGRQIALGRLEVGKSIEMDVETLKLRITDRSLLSEFLNQHTIESYGYTTVEEFCSDLRPRQKFVPRVQKETVEVNG